MKPQITQKSPKQQTKRRNSNLEDNLSKMQYLTIKEELTKIKVEEECKCGLNKDHIKSFEDNRLLKNLLEQEERYLISTNYFNKFQTKISETMRSILVQWMLEVCEEQECTDEVYSLAVNLFDRLLSILKIEKRHLQLLGTVCLFIASKLKLTNDNNNSKRLTAELLIEYTDNSISLEELLDWELLVIHKLKWDIASIVPNDFVDILIHQLNTLDSLLISKLRKHTLALTALCSTDIKFSLYPASMIAGACLMAALDGLLKCKTKGEQVLCLLKKTAQIEKQCLLSLKELVENLFQQSTLQISSAQQDVDIDYEYYDEDTCSNDSNQETSFTTQQFFYHIPLSTHQQTKPSSICTSSSGVESLLNTPEFY
jgi:G1/S-specific cyclin-D2